ncbi:hypothetical protein [Streptomyces sp. NPDC002343]
MRSTAYSAKAEDEADGVGEGVDRLGVAFTTGAVCAGGCLGVPPLASFEGVREESPFPACTYATAQAAATTATAAAAIVHLRRLPRPGPGGGPGGTGGNGGAV